jgi:hypothetical protein
LKARHFAQRIELEIFFRDALLWNSRNDLKFEVICLGHGENGTRAGIALCQVGLALRIRRLGMKPLEKIAYRLCKELAERHAG